jgi:hypothetical protein
MLTGKGGILVMLCRSLRTETAPYGGRMEVAKLLLDHGAGVDAQKRLYENALEAALVGGQE